MKSLKELYRIGTGPSSSHTMGPGFAAQRFLARFPEAASFSVILQGSLAATGRGHFTDRAISAVLGRGRTEIIWQPEVIPAFHPNGMRFSAFDADGKTLGEWTVYSVGGGALREEGELDDTPDVYPLADFADLDGNLLISNDPFEGVGVSEGKIILRNLPGLGLNIRK